MERVPPRRRGAWRLALARRTTAVAIVATLTSVMPLAGCVDHAGPEDTRVSAVYAAVVRWFVHDETGVDAPPATVLADDRLHVFLEPRGEGARIDLQVQTQLIDDLTDVAAVRFIDALDEAIEEPDADDGAAVVRDDGVLLRLDPVPEDGERVEVDVDRWIRSADGEPEFETLRFEVVATDESWRVDGAPEAVTPG